MLYPRLFRPTGWVALALSVLSAACGGGTEQQEDPAAEAPAVVSTLFADDGSVMPSAPRLTPADPGARTRAGRYASEAQAQQLEAALTEAAITTDVNTTTDDLTAVERAVQQVLRHQAAHRLELSAPVLVRGRDGRLAAAAAERLAALGFGTVFVVAP